MNQQITFEGDPIELPKGFKWAVHRYFTTAGMMPLTTHRFEDFPICEHKWAEGNFNFFILRKGELRIAAYCLIKHVKK